MRCTCQRHYHGPFAGGSLTPACPRALARRGRRLRQGAERPLNGHYASALAGPCSSNEQWLPCVHLRNYRNGPVNSGFASQERASGRGQSSVGNGLTRCHSRCRATGPAWKGLACREPEGRAAVAGRRAPVRLRALARRSRHRARDPATPAASGGS
jgi:hypothetical protein